MGYTLNAPKIKVRLTGYYTKFKDVEVVWTMRDMDHHMGCIVKSADRGRVLELMDKYATIVQHEFHAAAPAPDKPIH